MADKKKTSLIQQLTATGFTSGALASSGTKNATKKAAEPARQQAIQKAEKAVANATDRRSKAAASQKLRDLKYPLTGQDAKLGTVNKRKIQDAKSLWDRADRLEKIIGRTEQTQAIKRYAHNQAESVRITHGYTGGGSGEEQESPLLSKEERKLSKTAQDNLKQLTLWKDYGKRNKEPEVVMEADRLANVIRKGYTPSAQVSVGWADLDLPDKDFLQDDVEKARQNVKNAQAALRSYLSGRGGMATFRTNDLTLQRLQENLAKMEEAEQTAKKRLEQSEYIEKYKDMTFAETGDKWSDFWSQFKANLALGRIDQDASTAYSEYLKDPTTANLAMAKALSLLEEDFSQRNAGVLDDEGQVLPWISDSLAGYLPQFKDQTVASVKGAAAGAAAGAGVGFAAGGIGAIPGFIWGGRAGAVAGSGKYSYETMRGAAYRSLIEAGVDEETAQKASKDEGIISSIIEMADTGVDIFTFGIGSALTAGQKLAKALGKYGLNIGSEMGQEFAQQGVSIANQGRDDTGLWDLAKEAFGVTKDAATGKNPEAWEEMVGAAKEGGKIAALMGGAGMVTSSAVNKGLDKGFTALSERVSDAKLGKRVKAQGTETVLALVEAGRSNEETAYLAEPVASTIQNGKTPSDRDVGRLARALQGDTEAVRTESAQETESSLTEDAQETAERPQTATFASQDEVIAEGQNAAPAATKSVLESEDDILLQAAREMTGADSRETAAEFGYGQYGTQTFERILESSEMTVEEAKMRFQSAYEAGLTNTPRERVSLLGGIQEQAYTAGRQDYILTLNRAEDGSRYATVHGQDSGFIKTAAAEGVEPTLVNDLHQVSKALGIKTMFVEHIENGSEDVVTGGYMSEDGVLVIAKDALNPYTEVAKHEVTHRLQKLAPTAYTAFRNLAVEYESRDRGYGNTTMVEEVQDFYAENGVHLTTEQAMDEIAANFAERLFTNEKARKAMAEKAAGDKQAKTTMEKFWQAVRAFIQKVKKAFRGDKAKMDEAAQEQYGATIAELEEAERLWKAAYQAAVESVKKAGETKNATQKGGEVQFSVKRVNGKQIVWVENSGLTSKQLRNHNAVAEYIAKHIGEVYTIIESGQKVYIGDDLPGEYTHSKYTDSLRKRKPQLLKAKNKAASDLGLLIETATNRRWEKAKHTHNKDAKYGMYRYDSSFAFPVKDQAGAVADVRAYDAELLIRNASDSKKYLYDVVNIKENTTDAIDLQKRETRLAAHKAASHGSVSADSVARPEENVKKQFSMKDSTGKTLTKAQAEFFKDSKVRDDQGRLLVVYHGSKNSGFNEFRYSEDVQTGTDYGEAYYFTSDREKAGGYRQAFLNYRLDGKDLGDLINDEDYLTEGGEVKEVYLNLTDPLIADAGGRYYYEVYQEYFDQARREGKDGIIVKNVIDNPRGEVRAIDTYIAFSRNQIKNVTNKKPTGGNDIRFSLKSPVEQKRDLIALHNLDERKLMKSLDLGGFPMPSIAVTATDIPHTNFGDITLVMNKSTVDPKASKKNVVYSADAWPPTFPRIEYDVNRDAEIALYKKAQKAGSRLPDMYASRVNVMASSIEDYLNNDGSEEGVIARFKDEYAIKALYLADKGETVETKTQEVRHEKQTSEMLDAILDLFDEDVETLRKMPLNQLHAKYAEGMKQVLLDHGRTEQQAEMAVAKKGGAIGGFSRYISRIIRYAQEPAYRTETVTDTKAMEQDIDSRIDQKGYDKWLGDMFRDLIKDSGVRNEKDAFTPAGNRRSFKQTHYPVTLDNIAKAMYKQNGGDTVNVSGGFYGVKTLRAGTAKRFKSIADMHKLEGRLKNLNQEEAQAISDALDKRLSDVIQRIYEKMSHKGGNQFIAYDSIGQTMMEVAAGGKYTVDAIQNVFGKHGQNLGNQLAADVRDLLFDVSEMPVHIFEAKPERAVRFDEVLAAVVPDTVSAKLRERLSNEGVQVLEYKRDNDADRLAKVNSVEGAKFSLKQKDKDYLAAVERGDMNTAQKMVDEAAEAAGYTERVFHGTNADTIREFTGNENVQEINGPSLIKGFFSDDEEYSEGFGENVNAYYIDSKKFLAVDAVLDPVEMRTYLERNGVTNVKFNDFISDPDAIQGWFYEIGYEYGEDNIDPWFFFTEPGGNITERIAAAGYTGLCWDEGMGYAYMPFDSELVKSADPVTYDDSGNVIPLSERFSQGKPDIRFSIKAHKDLLKENAKLREVTAALKEQFETTKFAKVDKKALDRLSKGMLRDYTSRADINKVRENLNEVYTYLANGDTEGTSWIEAQRRAFETAVTVLEDASVLDDEMWQAYGELRKYLRTTAISISKEYEQDLMGYESIEGFRRANFGRLKIAKNGTPVDVVYQELAARWPEFFDAQSTINPADQLMSIADALDNMQPMEYNPYSHNMREAATWLANDILERFFTLPQAKPTFADKAQGKLTRQIIKDAKKLEKLRERKDQQREQQITKIKQKDADKLERLREQKNQRIAKLIQENREKVKTVQAKEKAKREEAVSKVKERYKAKESKASESRKARELRAKIVRHAKDLHTKLVKPTDKHHVPEDLRRTVAAVLDAINQESQFVIDEETGERKKGGEGLPTKRTQAFEEMRKQYQAILDDTAPDEGMVVDPAITAILERVTAMRDTPLHAMTSQELGDLWQALRTVEHMVNSAGKTLAFAKYERTSEWAQAFADDTATQKGRKRRKGKRIGLDLENPYTFFSHFGDAGKDMFRMLRDAQDHQQMMVEEVAEKVRGIATGKQVKAWQKETHDFTTDRGEKLTLTTAQVMEIYELTKREQARNHLTSGGIVQPQVESKKITRGTDAILLTENDLGTIVDVLTDEQVKVADQLQELTSTLLAEYGNEASMKAYGYKKFVGKDYWPIKSAKEGVHSNIEKGGNNSRSIKNIGLAKNVIPHASNPLDIGGIFKTFAEHAGDMTDYAAWLCPMEDAQRVFNFQFKDEDGQRTGKTIKGLMDTMAGTGAQDYFFNLMEDIQNGLGAKSDTGIMPIINKAVGQSRGASVGANLRVIVQQPTAILRAATILSPADMVAGLAVGGGWKTALEHSAIAKRKDAGGFDISSPAQMGEILFDDKTKLKRFNDAMMAGAGKADAVTWGRIWNACEIATQRQRKDLEKGSEAFYQEVNSLFTEVIDQSQVVDGVLQRSQIMRSSGDMLKAATAFMGEPIMALNMFVRSYDDFVMMTDKKKRGAALRTLGRTAVALVVTNVVNALAQSIVDAWRDDDSDKDYLERLKGQFLGLDGTEESAWDKVKGVALEGNLGASMNPALYIPFAKDIISMLDGFNVERADAAIVADIIQSAQALIKSMSGDGKTIGYAVLDLGKQVGKMFGISAPNMLRDALGIIRSVAVETGNVAMQWELEKAIYNLGGSGNRSRFLDILYRAYTTDQTAYKEMYSDMVEAGVPEDKIQNGMESRMKKDQGVNSVKDLEERFIPPAKQGEYESLMDGLESSDIWSKATQEQRDKVTETVYELTMDKESDSLAEKIGEGADYGIDEADWLLYELALAVADQPTEKGNYGSYNTAERAEAITSTGLSDEEMAWLWYSGMSYKSDEPFDALDAGVDMETYINFKAFESGVSADKDANGKSISGSKKQKIVEWLNENGVSGDAYNFIYYDVMDYKK